MGVPSEDCESVARLLGLKTIVNEFAAYQRLGDMVANNQIGKRAQVRKSIQSEVITLIRLYHLFLG